MLGYKFKQFTNNGTSSGTNTYKTRYHDISTMSISRPTDNLVCPIDQATGQSGQVTLDGGVLVEWFRPDDDLWLPCM